MNRRASVNYFSAISTAFLHYYPDHQGPRPWHVTLPRQRGPLHRRDQRLWNDINNSKNTKASQQWIEVANSRCSLVSLPSFYGLIVGLVLGQQPWFMEMLELGDFEEVGGTPSEGRRGAFGTKLVCNILRRLSRDGEDTFHQFIWRLSQG